MSFETLTRLKKRTFGLYPEKIVHKYGLFRLPRTYGYQEQVPLRGKRAQRMPCKERKRRKYTLLLYL